MRRQGPSRASRPEGSCDRGPTKGPVVGRPQAPDPPFPLQSSQLAPVTAVQGCKAASSSRLEHAFGAHATRLTRVSGALPRQHRLGQARESLAQRRRPCSGLSGLPLSTRMALPRRHRLVRLSGAARTPPRRRVILRAGVAAVASSRGAAFWLLFERAVQISQAISPPLRAADPNASSNSTTTLDAGRPPRGRGRSATWTPSHSRFDICPWNLLRAGDRASATPLTEPQWPRGAI